MKLADFDNCNLVLSETVFLDQLWCVQGKRGMSAIHLQIGQKKMCMCAYIGQNNTDLGEGEGYMEFLCTILQLLSKFKIV